ncbi:MAG TPA: hypothetical protein VFH52_09735 [Rhodanobacteraceae bacterium]|nr:hypothetical protein [Rhodanobacteraceae bacterium]
MNLIETKRQAMDGRVEVSFRRRRMTPSTAAGRAGKARLLEHMDVRVRAGARLARSAGQSSQPDVGETVMPGANGFGYFPLKESNPRRGTARKKDTDVECNFAKCSQIFSHPAKCWRICFPRPQAGEGSVKATGCRLASE